MKTIRSLALPLALVACGGGDQPPAGADPAATNPTATGEDAPLPPSDMPKAEPLPKEDPKDYPDLKIEVLKAGDGEPLAWDKPGRFHYTGVLLSGKQFDSSYQRGEPMERTLSEGNLIKGWLLGLQDMKLGEKRRLTIPPALGYGEQFQQNIPPGSTLVFTVELVEIPEDKSQ